MLPSCGRRTEKNYSSTNGKSRASHTRVIRWISRLAMPSLSQRTAKWSWVGCRIWETSPIYCACDDVYRLIGENIAIAPGRQNGIKWLGTHAAYDKVDARTVRYED